LVNESKDVLKEVESAEHREMMQKFMHDLVKNPGMVAYGKDEVNNALNAGSVDTLLLSENLDEDAIDELVKKAEATGTKVEIVSDDFEEGNQLWVAFGGMAALLRYKMG